MASYSEKILDDAVEGEKPLGLASRFESAHLPCTLIWYAATNFDALELRKEQRLVWPAVSWLALPRAQDFSYHYPFGVSLALWEPSLSLLKFAGC